MKKPIYKRWWFWGLIILIYINVLKDDDKKNTNTPTNTPISSIVVPNSQDSPSQSTPVISQEYDELELYADNLITSPKFIEFYVAKNNIKLNTFKDYNATEKFYNSLDLANDKKYNLKLNKKAFGTDYFSITMDTTEYEYYGNIKDNKPHGKGCIFKKIGDLNGNYLTLIQYIGNFKEGYYDGLGFYYIVPSTYLIDDFMRENIVDTEEKFEEMILRLNHVFYEGMFSKGRQNGLGNEYHIPSFQIARGNQLQSSESYISFYVGNFKDDEPNGKFKIYDGRYLRYDGEMIGYKYWGKGKLYFPQSNKLQYEGEFISGKYDGEGTLYDETGVVIYKGKWKSGDYVN